MANETSTPQPQQGSTPTSPQMGGADTVRTPEPARAVYSDWAAI